jgi:hypothetical protein
VSSPECRVGGGAAAICCERRRPGYLPAEARSDVIVEKVDPSWVPSMLTAVMMAMQIAAVISPYSIAVAARSSRRKSLNVLMQVSSAGTERAHRSLDRIKIGTLRYENGDDRQI